MINMNRSPVTPCFHCGEPVPPGARFDVVIDGAAQPMCCAGCAAVARSIADNRLTAYYRHRSELPQHDLAASGPPPDLAVYDLPDVQKSFVRTADGDMREAALILEGITCAACV